MENQNNRKITNRNLFIFTIIVFASGWIGKGLDALMGNPSKDSLGMLIWLVMPLLASLFLRAFGGDGWKDIGLNPLLKNNLIWYLFSLFVFPFVTVSVLGIGRILGWVSFQNFNTNLYLQAFAVTLLPNFFKNIPEEFVWRGYLTPKVFSLKINDFLLYFIVGLIWGVWHVPYYLFFLDSETLSSVTGISIIYFIPLSILVMIAWSVVFVELRLLTKSVWPAVMMHTIEDSFVNMLFIGGFVVVAQKNEIWVSPIYGVISIIFFAIIGLILRKIRKRNGNIVRAGYHKYGT
ncbi:MAG: CPBP family intramembrane glutamic endopeptidase [bacterium]